MTNMTLKYRVFLQRIAKFSFQKGENYKDAGNQNKIFQVALSL